MVHLRLNDSEANPNPHINFITALPMPDSSETESARQLLRALAAQVKQVQPVMKAHGFTVNSFEEYEYNQVFAGRNWNNGETVELVLRRKDGAFVSPSWLMSTLCHELAHIKHMNHGRDFQALWSQLRNEVRALQTKGYYGDGLWSAGTRLGDSAHVAGSGAEAGDLPEYICGGAQTTSRPSRRRRVRQPRSGPSRRTGAQTAKKRKPGSRVTAAGAFVGEGRALNAHITDEKEKKAGSGFGKRTQSKRAKEERAAAIERRLLALQGKASSKPEPVTEESQGEESSDSDIEVIEVPETDQERRKALDDTLGDADLLGLRSGTLTDFWGDFIVNSSTSAADAGPSKPQHEPEPVPALRQTTLLSGSRSTRDLGVGKMVQEEIRFRKAEALGMESRPKGRMLGAAPDGAFARDSERSHQASSPSQIASSIGSGLPRPPSQENSLSMWTCGICTLENEALHLACAACGTIRGEA